MQLRASVSKVNAQNANVGIGAADLPCGDSDPSPCSCGTGEGQGQGQGQGADGAPTSIEGLGNKLAGMRNQDTQKDVAAAKAQVDAQNKDRNDAFSKFSDGMRKGTAFEDRPMINRMPDKASDRPSSGASKGLSPGMERAGSNLDNLLKD